MEQTASVNIASHSDAAATSGLSADTLINAYEAPRLVQLQIEVPLTVLTSPREQAKKRRRIVRGLLLTSAGMIVTVIGLLGAAAMVPVSVPLAVGAGSVAARSVFYWHFDRGEVSRRLGYSHELVSGVRIAGLGTLTAAVVGVFATSETAALRQFLVAEWLFATLLWVIYMVGVKVAVSRLRSLGRNTRRVLLVGNSAAGRKLATHVEGHPESGYRMAGIVPFRMSAEAEPATGGQLLPSLIRDLSIDDLVFTSWIPRHVIIRLVTELPGDTRLNYASAAIDSAALRANSTIASFPLIDLLPSPWERPRALVKRGVDLVLGTMALVIALPGLLMAALAIRLTSPGPALYRQTRIGLHGRPFNIFKLRTMRVDTDPGRHQEYVRRLVRGVAEADHGRFKVELDGVTAVGRVLRRLSVDEFPQLLNVLNGTMSLVGPRPPMPYEMPDHDAHQLRRLDVMPGVTGLWQVSGRNRVGYQEMVQIDLRYIDEWSNRRDLWILSRTPSALLRREDTA